jgi:branched-chain amino acid transport system substrate-binding protein
VIGFVNEQGGPPNLDFPQPTRVIEAGVKMLNAELGGIHKHPVKLDECFIVQAEEEGVRCAQQMANDKAVKVILFGFLVNGNQSLYATLKGSKPIVGGVTANPADPTAKNTYFLNGSQTSVLGPFATFTKQAFPKVKNVTIVYPNQAGADTAAFALRDGMKKVGLKTTLIATQPNSTDLLGPATQASSADMIVPALGFTDCVPFARALDQIHYSKPVLSTPLCTFFPPQAYASGDLPKWIYGIAQTNVHYGPDKQAKLYLKTGQKYGAKVADMTNVFAEIAWEELLVTAKIMNSIPYPKISAATIGAALKKFPGPVPLAAPDIACGKASKGEPAACGNETQFYKYNGKGVWQPASGWLKPPR